MGLFDRYPGLKVVSVEAGAGYAPYLMDRLDAKFMTFKELVSLKRKPSEYIREHCYFVAEPLERTVSMTLKLVGDQNIMWGSDYPHIDGLADVDVHPDLANVLSEKCSGGCLIDHDRSKNPIVFLSHHLGVRR